MRPPVDPMRDPSLVRVLHRQSARQGRPRPARRRGAGPQAIADAFAKLKRTAPPCGRRRGRRPRPRSDRQGGQDFARSLVDRGSRSACPIISAAGADRRRRGGRPLPRIGGKAAVLSGSCSRATLAQLDHMRERAPVFVIDPLAAAAGDDRRGSALLGGGKLGDQPILFAATAPPETVAEVQAKLGRERAVRWSNGSWRRSPRPVAHGVRRRRRRRRDRWRRRQALGVTGLRIGRQIDPGVPWTVSLARPALALALQNPATSARRTSSCAPSPPGGRPPR